MDQYLNQYYSIHHQLKPISISACILIGSTNTTPITVVRIKLDARLLFYYLIFISLGLVLLFLRELVIILELLVMNRKEVAFCLCLRRKCLWMLDDLCLLFYFGNGLLLAISILILRIRKISHFYSLYSPILESELVSSLCLYELH